MMKTKIITAVDIKLKRIDESIEEFAKRVKEEKLGFKIIINNENL